MNKKQGRRAVIARYRGHWIDWFSFEYHVTQVRLNVLGDAVQKSSKVLNLCEDRYHFLVVFTASMLAGRTTVVPSNRCQGELTRLSENNEKVQLTNDSEIANICQLEAPESSDHFVWDVNLIPDTMIVAELYTSGSTGEPSVNLKTWGQLVNAAQQVSAKFGLDPFIQTSIIATVPAQHMFGFEMSIVLPLICAVVIHQEKPFYPLDVQRVLSEMPAPRVLVTTPLHLRACTTLTEQWPDIAFVMSATAALSEDVAQQIESIMNTDVKEVYGCSEAGAIATRQVMKDPNWTLLPDYTLSVANSEALLQVPTIQKAIVLPDQLEILSDEYFKLIARATDMIKIGGKRGSLSEITGRIKALPGVDDAVVFRSQHNQEQRQRLVALVVAADTNSEELREALKNEIDPVFLPRPLCVVPSLPYNSTGKLPKADLLACLNDQMNRVKKC